MAKLPRAIIDLEDYTESINVLIYGDSGVGKTVLAGTAPKCLILAVEPGTISAKRQGSKAKMWPIKHWSDFEQAYNFLRDNPDAFDWVVIDTATAVQTKALRAILENAVKQNPSRDPDIPAIQDHQKWQNIMKRFVVDFNELPINVIWTAQAMRKEDQEGDDLVLPLLLGKDYEISSWFCAQMHVVGYYGLKTLTKKKKGKDNEEVKEKVEVRRLLVQPAPPYFAKDRYDALGKWVDNPDMPTIIDMIESSGEEGQKRASSARRADQQKVKAFKGTVEPDDDDDDEKPEAPPEEPTEADADEEPKEDEETEESTPATRKAAKKVAPKKASKFRATTEDEE